MLGLKLIYVSKRGPKYFIMQQEPPDSMEKLF